LQVVNNQSLISLDEPIVFDGRINTTLLVEETLVGFS